MYIHICICKDEIATPFLRNNHPPYEIITPLLIFLYEIITPIIDRNVLRKDKNVQSETKNVQSETKKCQATFIYKNAKLIYNKCIAQPLLA